MKAPRDPQIQRLSQLYSAVVADVIMEPLMTRLLVAARAAGKPIILPRSVADLIRLVVCHSAPEKYALLYELVWRMRRPDSLETHLHEVASDKLVARLTAMAKSVRRDLHKMHAFVRFREVNDPVVGPRFVAWFEPDHFIVEETAKFFIDRFTSIDWAILTPKGSLWWDKAELAIGPPGSRADAPETDAFELGWRTYYESTFNPARTNLNQMRQHTATRGTFQPNIQSFVHCLYQYRNRTCTFAQFAQNLRWR